MSLIDFHIVRRHICVKHAFARSIQILVTRYLFQIQSRKEKIRMFNVANVITLILVSELPWKFNLLLRYTLNIFRPPRMNQFDISALLFGG